MTWNEMPAPLQALYPRPKVLEVRVRFSSLGDLYVLYFRDRFIRSFAFVEDDWRMVQRRVMADSTYRALVKR